MKNLNAIVSGSGILKSHEEFLERLGSLMDEYGFNSVYADINGGMVVFDNSNDGRETATEGLAFGALRDNSFHGVSSFFSYNNTTPAQYSRKPAATVAQEEPASEEKMTVNEPESEPEQEEKKPAPSRGWGGSKK